MLYESLKDYFVNDLVYKDSEVVFVLESPHTQEVKNGYPVAGKSGKDMSQVLFGLDEAFGKLIHDQTIKNIAIVNVCNYPLQKSAYLNVELKELEFFEKIRQNPKLRKSDKLGINAVIDRVMSDFAERLKKHKDKKIVLCGNFAQNCFETYLYRDNFQEVLYVPHPSFNNWRKEKYRDVIEELKRFVK
ncbi:MAG: uracil-DNA glycosylase family protein [Campylobacterota bacterium]